MIRAVEAFLPSEKLYFFFLLFFVFALASAKTGCPLGDKKIGSTSLPQAERPLRKSCHITEHTKPSE
jgi:hypothetical protein